MFEFRQQQTELGYASFTPGLGREAATEVRGDFSHDWVATSVYNDCKIQPVMSSLRWKREFFQHRWQPAAGAVCAAQCAMPACLLLLLLFLLLVPILTPWPVLTPSVGTPGKLEGDGGTPRGCERRQLKKWRVHRPPPLLYRTPRCTLFLAHHYI